MRTVPAPPTPPLRVPPPAPSPAPVPARPEREIGWGWVVGGLAVCAIVLLALERYLGVYMPDDAYITYRYAENLAAGNGLVFNAAAPPVEGYSNLSWIVLLAALARLGLDLPVWAANLGAALSVLNLGLIYALSYHLTRHRGPALLAPALTALTAPYALWARGGLETMWYATLLLLGVWLTVLGLDGRRALYPLAAVVLFVLALTRHDGAIPMALAGVFVLLSVIGAWRERRGAGLRLEEWLLPLGSFGLLALVYVLYTWWRGQYFGQLVPTPVFSRLGGTLADPGQIALTWGSYFTRGSHYSAYGDLLVPAFALAAADLVWLRRGRLRDGYILACVAALSLLYFVSESYNPGIRYMVPVLPLLYLYAQGPVRALLQAAGRATGGWATWRRGLALGGVGLALVLFLVVMAPRTRYDSRRAEQGKLQSLLPLGQWLGQVAPPGAAVALQDIGVIAYYSGLRVIDDNPGALTNGDVIYSQGTQGFADIALNPRPEFLVFTTNSQRFPNFNPVFEALKTDPRFTGGYQVYNKIKYWEDRGYWVYLRNDVTLPPNAQATFPRTDWYEEPGAAR